LGIEQELKGTIWGLIDLASPYAQIGLTQKTLDNPVK
jgi:hypothetical protein